MKIYLAGIPANEKKDRSNYKEIITRLFSYYEIKENRFGCNDIFNLIYKNKKRRNENIYRRA